MIEAFEDI